MADRNPDATENRADGMVDEVEGDTGAAASDITSDADQRLPGELHRGQGGAAGSGDAADLQSTARSQSDRASGTSS